MKRHLFQIVVALSLAGALVLATGGPAAYTAQPKAAPRSVKKATALVRQSATQLARDYSKGRAKIVCAGLTTKARKSLGGGAKCALTVRRVFSLKPISKISIKKITFRSNRTWATVSGYLNGNRKQRVTVVFLWESGRYRLDHSVTALSGLLG
ncbi:MAG: hypothetical protein WBQ14_04650 [Gaiellaceae bacterium]